MPVQLTAKEQEYIALQWALLRQANSKAAEFSREWNARSAELNEKGQRSDWSDYRLRQEREGDLVMRDLFGAWDFWQREAQRISAAIEAERTARILLGLM